MKYRLSVALEKANHTKQVKNRLIDLILVLSVLTLYFTSWITFPYKLPVVALLIIGVTLYKTKSIRELGIDSKVSVGKTVSWALMIFILGGIVVGKLIVPMLEQIFGAIDYSAYGALKGNKDAIIQLWFFAMISAAFSEEVLFRGYFCSLFEHYIGSSMVAKIVMVLLGALLFTFAHYSQGATGLISIFAVSLLFYAAFILSKKNLYALILGHALIDTFGLYQIYLGNY
jgi:hypothetical protein